MESKTIHPYVVKSSSSFADWIVLSLIRHPDAGKLRKDKTNCNPELYILPAESPIFFKVIDETVETEQPEQNVKPDFQPTAHTAKLIGDIRERLRYEYPYQVLSQTASKRTASKSSEEQEFSALNFAKARPDFLSRDGLTPAERGTALHKYMQYADFETAENHPEQELERMTRQGLLSEEESKTIPLGKVKAFFASPLYQRMKNSPELMREKQFNIAMPAGYFNPDLTGEAANEPTLMQGVVDAAFIEDGKIVILDYKTDHVKSGEELASMYTDQLHIYQYAMQEITGLEVSELILYSFGLGKQVALPL